MNKLRSQGGAALVWAVCAILILSILIAAMATVASAYHSRSLRDENTHQAYLTARGAADTLLAAVKALPTPAGAQPTADAAFAALAPWLPGPGKSVKLEDFSFDLGPLTGQVTNLELTCRKGEAAGQYTLAIQAEAQRAGSRAEVCLATPVTVAKGVGTGYVITWGEARYE